MMRVANVARPKAALLAAVASGMLAGCGTLAPVQVSASAGAAGTSTAAPGASASASRGSHQASHLAATRSARSAQLAAQSAGPPQRGIDVDWYDGYLGPGNSIASESPGYVSYIKGLGANWLSITFPLFEASRTISKVVRRSPTPSPADMSILIKDAHAAGLSVDIRPLLDSSGLGRSRVHWTPPDLAAWFASYRQVLMPYAQMAQRYHVNVFTVGVEFDYFASSSLWNGLDAAIRKVYKGRLAFANNWDQLPGGHSYGGSGVRQDVDAYPSIKVPDSATVATLTRHWGTWDSQLRAGSVLGEVGIPAQLGMYPHPYWWKSREPLARFIQVRWFAAACNAVVADHLGGIFFWSLPFGSSLTVPSNLADPGAFTATAGATEIARCFAKLKSVK
ncbi:MAG TPA: hypothetical protein VGI66_00475 [Streptosporangiaceae bacterium]